MNIKETHIVKDYITNPETETLHFSFIKAYIVEGPQGDDLYFKDHVTWCGSTFINSVVDISESEFNYLHQDAIDMFP